MERELNETLNEWLIFLDEFPNSYAIPKEENWGLAIGLSEGNREKVMKKLRLKLTPFHQILYIISIT